MRKKARARTILGAALFSLTTPLYAQSTGAALAPTEEPTGPLTVAGGTAEALTPTSARRMDITPPIEPSAPAPQTKDGTKGAATLLADRIALSPDGQLRASGHVVMWYQGARLDAETVSYDRRTGRLRLDGPIRLHRPKGADGEDEVLFLADEAELSQDFREGILRGARLVLDREMQLAAREAERRAGGRVTVMRDVVASSCQVCADDPVPLWEIRARQITHDAGTRRIYFDRPQLRAFGIPLAVLPALSVPEPGVSRAAGFLQPSFRTTSGLGMGVKLPYFIPLGDHADLTLTPYLSVNQTKTIEARYRQAMSNGEMEWRGALSRDDLRPGMRGYVFGAGRFELPREYIVGFQVQNTSDRAYLLDYGLTSADRLWSGITLDRVRRDRMMWARLGRYETLREDEDKAAQPQGVLDLQWSRRFFPAFGGEVRMDWSAHAHRRPSSADRVGRDMGRLSFTLGWLHSDILAGGLVWSTAAELNADVYTIRQDSRYSPTVGRIDPVAMTELRWPLARNSGQSTDILEPVVQLVWSPRQNAKTPNEDSQLLEFDQGNLFSLNRFAGRDMRETGLRANLGLGWTHINPDGWQIGTTVGRVMRARLESAFAGDGPLAGRHSDWLISARYQGSEGLSIASRALFDNSFHISRSETRLGWAAPGLELSAGYLWLAEDALENRTQPVSEATTIAGYQLSDGWWISGEGRYDFSAHKAQKIKMGVQYSTECVTVDLTASRRFTATDQIRPETDFGLSVRLGGFGRSQKAKGVVARRSCIR